MMSGHLSPFTSPNSDAVNGFLAVVPGNRLNVAAVYPRIKKGHPERRYNQQ
jgi:hypothetical protein